MTSSVSSASPVASHQEDPEDNDIFIDDDEEEETNVVIPPSNEEARKSTTREHDDILFQSIVAMAEEAQDESGLSKEQKNDLISYAATLQSELNQLQDRIIQMRESLSEMKREYDEQMEKSQKLDAKQSQRRTELKELTKEIQKAEKQLALAQEQESDIQMAIVDKERKITRLEEEIMKKKTEREHKEQPIIEAYSRDIERLKQEAKEQSITFKKYKEQREELLAQIDTVSQDIKELEEKHLDLQNQYNIINTAPERSKKQADMVTKAFLSTKEDLDAKAQLIKTISLKIKEQNKKKESIIDTTFVMKRQEDHELKKLISIEKEIKQYKAKYLQEAEAYKIIAGRTFSLEKELQQKKKSLSGYHDLLRAKRKEEDMYIQQLQRLKEHNAKLEQSIEKSSKKQAQMLRMKKRHEEKQQKTNAIIRELKSDVDVLIHKFLSDEKVSKEIHDMMRQKDEENKSIEETLRHMAQEERDTDKQILELSVQREAVAREAARSKQHFLDCIADTKSLRYVNDELSKAADEIDNNNKQLKKMYSLIKKDRNKFAKIIQENMQTLSQIADNKKIIENEHEVLSKKSLEKEKQLMKVSRQHDHHFANRESLRSTYSKHEMKLNERLQSISECENEIAKLNITIGLAQDKMVDLKKSFEDRLEQRNYTNIQLMDRNDELSILYEKSHVQQNIITKGETELEMRNKECEALKVQLSDSERKVSLLLKQLPDLRATQREKEQLIAQIEEARELSEEFSLDMEDPRNEDRWRRLSGEVPTDEELDLQMEQLEKKLASQKEHYMEKKLILDEITNASDKLRGVVVSGRNKTFDISMGMNDVQGKIRNIDHKMMAILSELSIYQATSMTQEAHITQLRNNLSRGLKRLDNNEPPSEEMEWEWRKARELQNRRRDQLRRRRDEQQEIQNMPASVTRTTALQRPTSYIPMDSELAIPKPYGFKPMMYSSPGGQMRHYRKPEPKKTQVIY